MKSKIMCFLIAVLIVFGTFSFAVYAENSLYEEFQSDTNENGIYGNYNGTFKWWIDKGTGSCGVYGNGIAENYENLKKYNDDFHSLAIEEGILIVGEGAFDGLNIKNVVLPSTLKKIGAGAFEGCKNLTSLDIPADLERIEDNAFSNCDSLKSVVLPENVSYIGKGAFSSCDSLKSVYIYSSSVIIDSAAFADCPNLKIVKFYGNSIEIKDENQNVKDMINITLLEVALPSVTAVLISFGVLATYIFCKKREKNR